jgi:anthranilate/para-aminobenzoate synthase component II
MKKLALSALIIGLCMSMSSCATLFGGKVSECQKTKPMAGQPQREVGCISVLSSSILTHLNDRLALITKVTCSKVKDILSIFYCPSLS